MATLTIVSDLHLEARPLSLDEILEPSLTSDVLCLLGDIGDPTSQAYQDFLAACAARFLTVLLLAGNNEYRNHDGGGRTMGQTEELIRAAAAAHPNVHFLQNAAHVLGDVVFIGTTLWSYLPDTPLPPTSDGEKEVPRRGGAALAAAAASEAAGQGPMAALSAPSVGGAAVADQQLRFHPEATAAQSDVRGVQDAVVELSISPAVTAIAAAAAVKGAGGFAAASQLQPLPQQQQASVISFPPPTPPSAVSIAAAVPSTQVQQQPLAAVGGAGVPLAIPSANRPRVFSCSAAAMKGGGGGCNAITPGAAQPGAMPAAPGRPAAAPQAPRFMSYSQPPPEWLMSPSFGTPCSSLTSGADGGAGGVDGRACRRRRLRHCLSLSSLRPDEPCPSWREVQARCRGGGGARAAGGSSSESDAHTSDTDSSSQSSDAEDRGGETSRFDCSVAGDGVRLLEQLSLSQLATATNSKGPAVAAAAPGPNLRFVPRAGARGPASSPGFLPPGAPADVGAFERHSVGQIRTLPGQGLIAAQAAAAAAAAAAVAVAAAAVTDMPSFLSDPGSIMAGGSGGGGGEEALKERAVAADASSSAITAMESCATSAPTPSPVAAATAAVAPAVGADTADNCSGAAPSPKLRQHPHHHHHHHHHRHSSHLPPPSTVREFIGATSLDYRRIFATPGGPAITPDVTNALFMSSLEYIRVAVAAAREQGLVPVVLSHHAPSMRGTSRPTFAGHPSTHAYSTDLQPYLSDSGIAAWYCGHTHYNFDVKLPGGVRLASNQFGSQPKPAEGYSRTWQHRLPGSSKSTESSGRQGAEAVTGDGTPAEGAAAEKARLAATGSLQGSAFRSAPLGGAARFGFGAIPAPASTAAY